MWEFSRGSVEKDSEINVDLGLGCVLGRAFNVGHTATPAGELSKGTEAGIHLDLVSKNYWEWVQEYLCVFKLPGDSTASRGQRSLLYACSSDVNAAESAGYLGRSQFLSREA